MFKFSYFLIFHCQLLCAQAVFNEWAFAVAAKNKITFFDSDWNSVSEDAHQYDYITALAFNEIENEIFFNSKNMTNGSIHMLKPPNIKGTRAQIDTVMADTEKSEVTGIAFDPLSQTLFWSDETKRKISSLVINGTEHKPVDLVRLDNPEEQPFALSLDICRRKLYWTQSERKNHFSVNKMSLDGSKKEKIIEDIEQVYGIAVDQFSARIFLTVKTETSLFTVESFNLDGTDRQIIVEGYYQSPHGLIVTADSVIWMDPLTKHAYKAPKMRNLTEKPHKPENVTAFNDRSFELVSKMGILHKYKSIEECKGVMKKIEKSLHLESSKITDLQRNAERNNSIMCLDNGILDSNSVCQCKPGFTGQRCQIDECYNFCVYGTCKIEKGFPSCNCVTGYMGKKCETSICHNYCLNGGQCNVYDKEPVCSCKDGFKGSRCEHNSTETCHAPCILPPNLDESTNQCSEGCDTTTTSTTPDLTSENHQRSLDCPNSINKSIIVIVVGVVASLGLVYLIIQALRRVYKPERPRIRKTFVVKQHKDSNTPLTSRPIATEECQITIENCCNMNICETPCFDPKLLQENMSHSSKSVKSKKEDKQVLLPDLD